jgi:hypothetical protein
MVKVFTEELDKFLTKVKQNEPFALVRFADGEGSIIDNNPEWLHRVRASAEWRHLPNNKEHEKFRAELTAALACGLENYFIGVPSPAGHHLPFHYMFDKLVAMTTVPEEQLTFSSVFKDYNWKAFKNKFLPQLATKSCYLICNEFARVSADIPIRINEVFTVPKVDAHLQADKTYKKVQDFLDKHETRGGVFLFAAGPGTGVVVHKLWKEERNRQNFFIDIGSTIDPYLFAHSECQGLSRLFIKRNGNGYTPHEWPSGSGDEI